DGDRRLTRRPSLPKGLPADQCAPKRRERLVSVGPLVVANAQAAKLIQPRKRPFHHPAPAPQATAVLRSTHGQQRMNVANAQTVPDGLPRIRTIPPDPGGATAGAAPVAP